MAYASMSDRHADVPLITTAHITPQNSVVAWVDGSGIERWYIMECPFCIMTYNAHWPISAWYRHMAHEHEEYHFANGSGPAKTIHLAGILITDADSDWYRRHKDSVSEQIQSDWQADEGITGEIAANQVRHPIEAIQRSMLNQQLLDARQKHNAAIREQIAHSGRQEVNNQQQGIAGQVEDVRARGWEAEAIIDNVAIDRPMAIYYCMIVILSGILAVCVYDWVTRNIGNVLAPSLYFINIGNFTMFVALLAAVLLLALFI